jgi:hypothetical protein
MLYQKQLHALKRCFSHKRGNGGGFFSVYTGRSGEFIHAYGNSHGFLDVVWFYKRRGVNTVLRVL